MIAVEDLERTPLNRVTGHGQLVDELRVAFAHSKPMNGSYRTNKWVTVDFVVVAQFCRDKLACEFTGITQRCIAPNRSSLTAGDG